MKLNKSSIFYLLNSKDNIIILFNLFINNYYILFFNNRSKNNIKKKILFKYKILLKSLNSDKLINFF